MSTRHPVSAAPWHCLWVFPPLIKGLSLDLGPLTQRDLILTSYSCKDPVSKLGSILRSEYVDENFGGYCSTLGVRGVKPQKRGHRHGEGRGRSKSRQGALLAWGTRSQSHWGPLQSMWNAPLHCRPEEPGAETFVTTCLQAEGRPPAPTPGRVLEVAANGRGSTGVVSTGVVGVGTPAAGSHLAVLPCAQGAAGSSRRWLSPQL